MVAIAGEIDNAGKYVNYKIEPPLTAYANKNQFEDTAQSLAGVLFSGARNSDRVVWAVGAEPPGITSARGAWAVSQIRNIQDLTNFSILHGR